MPPDPWLFRLRCRRTEDVCPSALATVHAVAGGILRNYRNAFWIHSPESHGIHEGGRESLGLF